MGTGHEGEVDELTAGTARLRALARALVGDAHAAEDLVQDAWVVALERGRPAGEAGSWLGGVLKRLAQHRARSERHRADRELAHARSSRKEPNPDERLDSVEQLVAAVRALDEPYKTAILLRYFEDQRPPEIAARLGVPVRTVHTRLARALAELRERLDRRHGDRGAWMALFAPLAKAPGAALVGGWIVQTKSKIALAVVVVLCLGAAWFAAVRGDGASASRALAPSEALRPPETPPGAPRASTSGAGERTALAAPDTSALATAPTARIRGVVIGLDDLPLADQRVVFVDDSSHAPIAGFESVSDAQGRFDLPHPGRRGALDLADSPFVTVLQPVVLDPPEDAELVLVAARRAPLAGIVVDADDHPIEGAELRIDAPGLRGSVLRILDRSRSVALRTRSGAQGRFVIPDAPAIPEANLVTSCPKFLTDRRTLSGDAESALIIRMEIEPQTGRWLRGKVVDPEGHPVPDARVGWIPASRRLLLETTDQKGRFALAVPEFPAGVQVSIQAVAAGYLPAMVASSRATADDPPQWPDPLILKLAQPASSIGGRVLDANGVPVVGAELQLSDQHSFGRLVVQDVARTYVGMITLEGVIVGEPFAWDRCDRSAADGSFEIRGLLEEPYQLRCFDPSSLAVVRTEPIPAGARDVVIHLPPIERIPFIAGAVVDSIGQPVAGADVTLLGRDEDHDDRGNVRSTQDLTGAHVKTDREGRFEFRDAPHGMTSLSARTPDSLAIKTFQLADQPDPEHLRLEVSRACHVQVDLRGSAVTARTAAILDAHGEIVELTARTGDAATTIRQFMLLEGRSAAVIAPEDSAMLVLSDIPEGQQSFVEVARIPIHLKSGELNVLRP